ncbi:hypothetical protein M8J77_018336 [Diaphorina citri]|nr:hypothetical protein M8J77_018336 [Diaphorina citri]
MLPVLREDDYVWTQLLQCFRCSGKMTMCGHSFYNASGAQGRWLCVDTDFTMLPVLREDDYVWTQLLQCFRCSGKMTMCGHSFYNASGAQGR